MVRSLTAVIIRGQERFEVALDLKFMRCPNYVLFAPENVAQLMKLAVKKS